MDINAQSPRRRAVIFDFGGVFMKTVDYTPRHSWDDRLRLPHGSVEHIVHGSENWRQVQMGRMALEVYHRSIGRYFGLTLEETDQLIHDFYSGDQLDEVLVAYTRQLRAAGHPVALLSNESPALRDKLRTLGIDDLFDPLVISALIGIMKPDARAFQFVLDRLHLMPNRAIFVDDMPANVAAAESLGLHAVRYTSTAALQSTLLPLLME